MELIVCARNSPLSLKQVEEVFSLLPTIPYRLKTLATHGDRDRNTSLRTMGKTDFFTRELDQMLLHGEADIAIHSAKDLPDPLPEGLEVIALTAGVDSSDSLVLREGMTLSPGMKIATSSERREEMVKELMDDCTFIDLRGTIHERLTLLEEGKADGVVVAEAALIRLGLTYLNRIRLPGETVPGQGQLAIVAKAGHHHALFQPIDVRCQV